LARVGQHVPAGQPIAIMRHTGDAAGLGHRHIEIGFSDASGDPVKHYGALVLDALRRGDRTVVAAPTHGFASLIPIGQSKEEQ
jgi:murein DD-endopeptidase MepM/ murein hydrolase activator NlpD